MSRFQLRLVLSWLLFAQLGTILVTFCSASPSQACDVLPNPKQAEISELWSWVHSQKDRFDREWRPPTRRECLISKIHLKLDGSGNVRHIETIRSSHCEAEERAIRSLMHFPPLPKGLDNLELFVGFLVDGKDHAVSMGTLGFCEESKTFEGGSDPIPHLPSLPPVMGPHGCRDIDFGPYMTSVSKAIRQHWFPPKGLEGKRVVVKFCVGRSGAVKSPLVESSSYFADADKSALEAVVTSSPLNPLPAGAPDEVTIQFTFDYNFLTSDMPGSDWK